MIDSLARDLRHAVRQLFKSPAFSLTAIAILGLGIGANAAIFSVVNGVILRPLPYSRPDRLVRLYGTPTIRGDQVERLDDFRLQSTSFDALVGYAVWRTAMLGRLSAGAHIGAGQAKVLVLVCTIVVVLQSASLSFARGDDRPPDFQST